MRHLIPAVIFATICCAGTAIAESTSPGTCPQEEAGHSGSLWSNLLACAEERTPKCKGLIEQVAEDSSALEPVRQLANILLEEWKLEPLDPSLTRARKVVVPMPAPDEARSLLPSEFAIIAIVVSGVITPEGKVKDVVLLRPSEYEKLNDRVVEAFCRARYRPAWSSGGFVSQKVEYLYRLEPRT